MIFRNADIKDINEIITIINDAKAHLKNNNIDQWQNGYPNKEVIKSDIKSKNSYVLIDNNSICSYFMISFDGEHTYNKIYEGSWSTDEAYAVIHRVVVSKDKLKQGLTYKIFSFAEELCKQNNIDEIRIDTHEDNIMMQNALKRNGFTYRGIIYLDDNSKRLAYEKLL